MSFQEKSNARMLGAIVLVYGIYFALVLGSPVMTDGELNTEIGLLMSNGLILVTVVALVAIAIFGHIVIALLNHKEAGSEDERDKLIEMRGDQRGGFVMGVFAVCAMGLAMIATPHFWIVNTILGGLVAAEIVKAVSKLIDCRRGV
jgi:small-conductance mechanosensitive channel